MPGAPGMKMYSREDLMNQNFGDEDAEDEDDDDSADLPSKLVSGPIPYKLTFKTSKLLSQC